MQFFGSDQQIAIDQEQKENFIKNYLYLPVIIGIQKNFYR